MSSKGGSNKGSGQGLTWRRRGPSRQGVEPVCLTYTVWVSQSNFALLPCVSCRSPQAPRQHSDKHFTHSHRELEREREGERETYSASREQNLSFPERYHTWFLPSVTMGLCCSEKNEKNLTLLPSWQKVRWTFIFYLFLSEIWSEV